MKHSALLTAALCGTGLLPNLIQAAQAQSAPQTKPQSKPARKLAIPPEVRNLMVPGAKTRYFALLPIGVQGAPVLLHVWVAQRRRPNAKSTPALVCIDLLSKFAATDKTWDLAASTTFLDRQGYPNSTTYETHWLQPKTRQGLVVVERNHDMTGSILQMLTWPDGVGTPAIGSMPQVYLQTFGESHSGGGSTSYVSFGRDARGQMTVERRIQPKVPVPAIHEIYRWKENHWDKVIFPSTPR